MGPVTGLGMALLFPALLFCGFQLVAIFFCCCCFLNLFFVFLIWILPPLCPSDCLYFVQSVVLQEAGSDRSVQTDTFQP